MRRLLISIAALGMSGFLLAGCAYNPVIDREQLLLVPDEQMVSLAGETWTEVQQKTPLAQEQALQDRARRVADRLLLANQKKPDEWEVKVFEDERLNAFALPGGRIGITSAMMVFCRNDDELAAVIGHEVAHVTLQHASERLSQDMAMRGAVGAAFPEQSKMQSILGVGALLGVILPYSRRHELEADRIGLRYLVKARYAPDAAISLWTRMASSGSARANVDWLSTHPTDESRIAALEAEIEKIKQEKRS
jgi:predicted Zn-dependent protease